MANDIIGIDFFGHSFASQVQIMFNNLRPVGSVYTQYPGTLSPNDLWGNTGFISSVWQELNYDGASFRANHGTSTKLVDISGTYNKSTGVITLNPAVQNCSLTNDINIGFKVIYVDSDSSGYSTEISEILAVNGGSPSGDLEYLNTITIQPNLTIPDGSPIKFSVLQGQSTAKNGLQLSVSNGTLGIDDQLTVDNGTLGVSASLDNIQVEEPTTTIDGVTYTGHKHSFPTDTYLVTSAGVSTDTGGSALPMLQLVKGVDTEYSTTGITVSGTVSGNLTGQVARSGSITLSGDVSGSISSTDQETRSDNYTIRIWKRVS